MSLLSIDDLLEGAETSPLLYTPADYKTVAEESDADYFLVPSQQSPDEKHLVVDQFMIPVNAVENAIDFLRNVRDIADKETEALHAILEHIKREPGVVKAISEIRLVSEQHSAFISELALAKTEFEKLNTEYIQDHQARYDRLKVSIMNHAQNKALLKLLNISAKIQFTSYSLVRLTQQHRGLLKQYRTSKFAVDVKLDFAISPNPSGLRAALKQLAAIRNAMSKLNTTLIVATAGIELVKILSARSEEEKIKAYNSATATVVIEGVSAGISIGIMLSTIPLKWKLAVTALFVVAAMVANKATKERAEQLADWAGAGKTLFLIEKEMKIFNITAELKKLQLDDRKTVMFLMAYLTAPYPLYD